MVTWKCHICGRIRPDNRISVWRSDLTQKFLQGKGLMKQNVRFCNDNPDCKEKAKTFRFFPKKKEDE